MEEIWKSVKGYENYYEISNLGNLRSLDRIIIRSDGVARKIYGKKITPVPNSDGYLQAKLCKDGKQTTVKIHRIVALNFVDNPNNLPEVNHKDFNRSNNVYTNLEWVDHISNVKHSSKQGHYVHYGVLNSNYGNTTLKKYYLEHPEECKKLGRIGKQNGRATPVRVYFDKDIYKDFSYIGECAEYLKNHGYISYTTSINSIRTNISLSIKKQKTYHNLKFEYI